MAFTREELETALDAGKLYVKMNNGKYWRCRRNGKTQLWKTRPNEFRIPVKFGFRYCDAITHNDLNGDWQIKE
jgi:hypothetical protein